VTSPQRSYDELWRGYWGDMQRLGPVHRHIREDIVRRVGALDVESILDVGCGSGENLAALAAAGRGPSLTPQADSGTTAFGPYNRMASSRWISTQREHRQHSIRRSSSATSSGAGSSLLDSDNFMAYSSNPWAPISIVSRVHWRSVG